MQTLNLTLLVLLCYLIGSVPFGLLLAKSRGKNIRAMGSGNIGATNVLRCLGKPLGITCFVLDVLKGFLPAFLFPTFGNYSAEFGILFGAAAILGHNFPVFLRFKGGKGVATSAGVLLGVAPLGVFVGIVVWALVFFTSGYVSLGSIVAAVAVVAVGWSAGYPLPVSIALTLLGALAVWRHRANIQRLIAGTENKFERKKNS
jgi:acyl phosphate:glycerol-3-phosphate acyltransferase